MRYALSGTLILALLPTLAASQDHYGRYSCLINRSVGIIHSDDQVYAGQIILPASQRQFVAILAPVAPNPQTINLCRESVTYYLKILESRLPYSTRTPTGVDIGPRTVLGDHCFTRDEITVKYSVEDKMPFTESELILRSYNDDMAQGHFGDIHGNWMNLSPDGRFMLVLQYANGPSIEEGRCQRVDQEH